VKIKSRLGMTFDEMAECLRRGEMQMHRFSDGVIVTEIKQLPEERILNVVWLAGINLDGWKSAAHEALKAFAKEHGCRAIEAACRPGLALSLEQLGYRTIKRLVRAEV